MAGPNDIGALRGIIGDGQSMNDEDIRTKAYGKRPGADNKLTPVKVPTWSPEKHLTFIQNGQRGNAMDVFAKFNVRGQDRKIDSSVPHVVNRILHDRHAVNKEDFEMKTILVKKGSTGDQTPSDEKKQAQHNYELKKYKYEQAKLDKQISDLDGPSYIEQAKAAKLTAEAHIKETAAEKARRDLLAPSDPLHRLVRVQSSTFTMPGVKFDLSKKNKKGALNIPLSKKERLNIALDKRHKGKYQFGVEAIVPTRDGLEQFAGDLANNLGSTISQGRMIGPFTDTASSKKLAIADLQKKAYLEYLHKKLRTGRNMRTLYAKITPTQQTRLQSLSTKSDLAETNMTSSSFLGGASGQNIISRSQPRMNFQPYTLTSTPRTQFSELGQGMAYPEFSARLGVQQTMASGGQLDAYNQNKWDVMLNRSSPDQKIFNILGKAPDPLGKNTGESAQAKIKRLSGL